jgi:hypothetical protein
MTIKEKKTHRESEGIVAFCPSGVTDFSTSDEIPKT